MKKKVFLSFITGMIALTGLQMTIPVYAEESESLMAESVVESGIEEDVTGVPENVTCETGENQAGEEILDSEEQKTDDLLSSVSKEESDDEVSFEVLPNSNNTVSSDQEEETSGEGKLDISYDNNELTSVDPDETFYVSFSGETLSDAYMNEPSALRITLDKGFKVTDIAAGKWSGSDGNLNIRLYDVNGNPIGSMSVVQESLVDCAGYDGITDIVFESERYSDSIEDIRITGIADKELVSDPLTISAFYGSADQKTKYAEETTEVSTAYLNLALPEAGVSSTGLYLNDSSILEISDFTGNREIDEMEFRFTIPDGITLSGITIPDFAGSAVTAFLDGKILGEEAGSEISSMNGKEVSVKVKTGNGEIRQMSSLFLTFFNNSNAVSAADIKTVVSFLFSDGIQKEISLKDIRLNLLGTAADSSSDQEVLPDTDSDGSETIKPEENDTEENKEIEKKDEGTKEKAKEQIIKVINPAGIPLATAVVSLDNEPSLYQLFNQEREEEAYAGESIVTEEIKDASDVLKRTGSDEDENKSSEKVQNSSSSPSASRVEDNGNIYRKDITIPVILLVAALVMIRILIHIIGRIRRRGNKKEKTN